MASKIILSLSALLLFLCGGIGLFVPDELVSALGGTSSAGVRAFSQVGAAALLGFSVINWMSRGTRFGGIYNRALGMGNLLLFAVAAMSLGREAFAGRLQAAVAIAAIAFGSLALAFAWVVLVRDPLKQ